MVGLSQLRGINLLEGSVAGFLGSWLPSLLSAMCWGHDALEMELAGRHGGAQDSFSITFLLDGVLSAF